MEMYTEWRKTYLKYFFIMFIFFYLRTDNVLNTLDRLLKGFFIMYF